MPTRLRIARLAGQALTIPVVALLVTPAVAQNEAVQNPPSKSVERPKHTGRVLQVGPSRVLKTPSAAAKIARSGDLIEIDAGAYRDCAVWRTPNLRIRGVGGYAHVRDVSCDEKAIWVFYASPVQISQIRFSGARVRHNNGAGIRWEGHGRLLLEKSWVHNNQMGILAHNSKKSRIIIKGSKFEANGDCPEFCGHGVYVGHLWHLAIFDSEFSGHKHGHHIKSRAYHTEITGNRIIDGADGTASYAINLPDSGTARISYNFVQQGPKTENSRAVVAIGEEGPWNKGGRVNPSRFIVIEGNVFRNDNRRKTNFVWNRGPDPVTLRNNRFNGPGVRYRKSRRK